MSTGPVGTHYDLRRVESPRYFRIAFRITSDFGTSSSTALLSSAATSPGSRRNTTFLLLRSSWIKCGRPIRFFARFVTLRRRPRFCKLGKTDDPHTQKIVQVLVRKADLQNGGVHVLRHSFCSHLAMRGAPTRGARWTQRHHDDAALHAPEFHSRRQRDPLA